MVESKLVNLNRLWIFLPWTSVAIGSGTTSRITSNGLTTSRSAPRILSPGFVKQWFSCSIFGMRFTSNGLNIISGPFMLSAWFTKQFPSMSCLVFFFGGFRTNSYGFLSSLDIEDAFCFTKSAIDFTSIKLLNTKLFSLLWCACCLSLAKSRLRLFGVIFSSNVLLSIRMLILIACSLAKRSHQYLKNEKLYMNFSRLQNRKKTIWNRWRGAQWLFEFQGSI